MPAPLSVTISLSPTQRLDTLDVFTALRAEHPSFLTNYPRVLLASHHTTAGLLDATMRARLQEGEGIQDVLAPYRTLFPPHAGYAHDRMADRDELSPVQRQCEPRNADAHLIYLAAGMRNTRLYTTATPHPPVLVDLDGINNVTGTRRTRYVTAIGLEAETTLLHRTLQPPHPHHPPAVDLTPLLRRQLRTLPHPDANDAVRYGRLQVALPDLMPHAALVVNEHEPLLMEHDVAQMLHDPSFAAPSAASVHAAAGASSVPQAEPPGSPSSPKDALRLPRTLSIPFVPAPTHSCGYRLVLGRYQRPLLLRWGGPSDACPLMCMLTQFA